MQPQARVLPKMHVTRVQRGLDQGGMEQCLPCPDTQGRKWRSGFDKLVQAGLPGALDRLFFTTNPTPLAPAPRRNPPE